MHTPVLKQRNAANPFERDGRQWTCNECPYILCKVLTPNRATTRQVAPTPAPAMIMICNGIAIKAFICVSPDRKLFYFCFLLLFIFCYCYCYLFIIVFYLLIYLFIYLLSLFVFSLSGLVFDMYLPTATYFINLAFFFLLCFLFVYLN